MLAKESENESRWPLPSGRPSDWPSAAPSPGKLLDGSKLEGTAASALPSPFSSAPLDSGTWAKA